MDKLLAQYPVVVEIPVAWGDMDAMQHVNNTVYFRYFETARIAYFERLGLMKHREETGIGPILAQASCKFKFPLTYPDTVFVGSRVCEIGEDRVSMEHRIVSKRHQRVAAEGTSLIVTFNYREQRKAPLPADMLERIASLESRIP
jgi:acyl-CoA thioester hydrolase